jgi:citrate lyase beta subunit
MAVAHRHFARRSLLFMPGDSLKKIQKAAGWEVDTVLLDLEDSVAPSQKAAARAGVAAALHEIEFNGRERLVRLNHAQTELPATEIEATAPARPDGYIVPKVESAADLLAVDRLLASTEVTLGLAADSLRLFAMVETALGVMNLPTISQACSRLEGLILGAEDLASDLGAVRTAAGWEVFYARSALVTAAAANGLQAFDMVFTDFQDAAGLEAESRFARQLGYTGKTCIHPKQTPVVNQAFAPTAAELERAQRLVAAFEAQHAAGAGAFTFEGRMVDLPMLAAARKVLTRAR